MIFARLREEIPSTNSVRHLQTAIATAFKIDLWVILGRSRRHGPVRIRHIALMLAHCCYKTSREDVSRRFDRNPATVMYAEKKLAAFLEGATSQIGGA
jgi:chromosomal replication initiation ATPase DnaA